MQPDLPVSKNLDARPTEHVSRTEPDIAVDLFTGGGYDARPKILLIRLLLAEKESVSVLFESVSSMGSFVVLLAIEQLLLAAERDYSLEDFLPHTKQDVEEMYARLRETVAGMKNTWLQRLLARITDDPAIAAKLKRAPAAMTMHHAYLGGLLEHILSVCGLVRVVASHYREVDVDLLLAGAILHDIGKIDELSYTRAFTYTTEGQLLGHIVIALALVRKQIEAIPDFPRPLAMLVEHLLVSHHGSNEFGSPRPPMFREAVLLHYLDDLDSKMGAMRATLDSLRGEGEWSERNPSLRRLLLRTEKHLRGPETQDQDRRAAPGNPKARVQKL